MQAARLAVALAAALGCTNNTMISTVGGNGGAGASPGGGKAGASGTGGTPGTAQDAGFGFDPGDASAGGAPGAACTNLCTRRVACPGGGDTTLSGTVLAPTPPRFGKPDPIYNALVYVPNAPVEPFKPGVSCEMCGAPASGSPLVTTLTGPDGKFTLKNVPVGANIPLVILVGRWRRQVTIPNVDKCADTPLDAELTRLPRNKKEGDIPLFAISTGAVDGIECVLRKIGVEESEFTLPDGGGRIHMYQANGAHLGPATPRAETLTGSLEGLKRYDVAVFECEGRPIEKTPMAKQNVIDYASAGGRLFFTHYSYTWLHNTMPFMGTANWRRQDAPTQNDAPITATVDQTFPKGMAFAKWLEIVGATSPMPGQLQIGAPRHDLDMVIPPAQRWIYTDAPLTVQHFTFNTPVGQPEDKQCGRALYSDFHVNGINFPAPPMFPTECTDTPLTAQEKALEFMLFDLSSCVQPDSKPPIIP
jgi:hypothetical protein